MPPAAPTAVTVTEHQHDAYIAVGWTVPTLVPPATATAQITVHRRTMGSTGSGMLIHTDNSPNAGATASFNDHMAPLETDLEYRVTATDAGGDSTASAWTA